MSTVREVGSTISAGVGPSGSGGTVHAGGRDISSGFRPSISGTIHASGPDISSGHGPSPFSTGVTLDAGDSFIINSITYQYEGIISKSTGEAEIFLLSHSDKKCVLKLYYPNFKPKEDIIKQLKQIHHDDIINVHDYGYYHDRFFEIMDFAEGGTLDKYLPIKDAPRIKKIIAEVIHAYKFCHAKGIIHKDIKPQNLYFKNADGSDVLIGDFGISSILETGMSRHLTSQSLTVGYAAPEMYGIGGKAYVGQEVDYYALGITIIHIWDGKNPFDDLNIHAISNLTTSGNVHIPGDMPQDMQNLVKGLITVDYSKRWGYDEIQRWLKGEKVPLHFQVKEISYPPYQYSPTEVATTTEELAGILKNNLDKGQKHLYRGRLSAWVNHFNQGLAVELDRIVEDDYPKDQDAGIQKAIYLLDTDEPFVQSLNQGVNDQLQRVEYRARTTEELADILEMGFKQYLTELDKPNHLFYLYLEAHDAEREARTFRNYFKTFSAKKALNTIILELRGRDSFALGGELFSSPEQLLRYKDQQFIVNELKDTDTQLSLWIEGSSFAEVKTQVENWRQLDKQEEATIEFALRKGGPLSVGSNDKAIIYYDIARLLVLKRPDKALEALGLCLSSANGESYFSKIAIDSDFVPIKVEICSLLLDYVNRNRSQKESLINNLRKGAPEHPLIKRFDNEQTLFAIRLERVKQDLHLQEKKQKNDVKLEFINEKAKKKDEFKAQYDAMNKGEKNRHIQALILQLIIYILVCIYSNTSLAKDLSPVALCLNIWVSWGVFSFYRKRNKTVAAQLSTIDYSPQLTDRFKQIDTQINAALAQASTDILDEISVLSDETLTSRLKLKSRWGVKGKEQEKG